MAKGDVLITAEKKEIESESEPEHAFYGDSMIPGEPIDCQILHFIASSGDEGCTSNDVVAHFGIDHLLFRTVARVIMGDERVERSSRVSKKTNQYVYKIKNAPKDNSVQDSLKEESEHEFSDDVSHLSTNMERLKAIHRVFQKQKVLTRPEIRKFLRIEPVDPTFAQIDGKTLNRLLKTLCDKGKILHLVLKGSGVNDKVLDMYYLVGCSKEELDKKVDIIKTRLERPQSHEAMEGISHVYLHAHGSKHFPDPIPESFVGFGDYVSPGVYHGPKMIFAQQFHLMLSVLVYRWPIVEVLPRQHLNLKDWWEYVLKLDPLVPNENGEFEVADFINCFPIYFLQYFNKKMTYDSFFELMEHKIYSRRCIGQLSKQLLVDLSGNISHVCNSFAKTIEFLETMDLVEIKQKFDYTKKSLSGFKFCLRKTTLLLNTAYAPINKDAFKGYNIRRIHLPRRILAFNVSDDCGFFEFWDKAENICLSGTFHESAAFCQNISDPVKSLLQVFKDHGIPLDQTEQFYNSPGTVERLNAVYSELGPGGFLIKLRTNKQDHWCSSIKTSRKTFRPELAITNTLRTQDNLNVSNHSTERVDSDSDDYVIYKPRGKGHTRSLSKKIRKKEPKREAKVEPKVQSMEKESKAKSKQPSLSNSKFIPTSVRKRKLSVRDHSVAKRIRKKYRDDIDLKINSIKTSERVKFTEMEDDVIITWSVCLKLFAQPHCPYESRNLLHNCCPKDAADKTEESTKKRRALLLDRPEVMSRVVDLQAKGTAFKEMTEPRIDKAMELFKRREEWATDLFVVRSILPASFADFIDRHEVKDFSAVAVNHLTVFLTEGYRNKRVLNFKECNVASIWENTEFSDYHKQIYNILLLAVGTQTPMHNEAAFKVIKSVNEVEMSKVSDYMYKHQILRRQKRRVTSDGNIAEAQRVAVNTEAVQCLYSPFPDDLLSNPHDNHENPLEIHYSELNSKVVHNISQAHFKGNSKVIISGAIDPFIENKKFDVVLHNVDAEVAAFAEMHTKRNTFFSGLSTVEEGKTLGFQLSEKHITGRFNYKVHSPNEEDKVEGYEELLGMKESSWPLPLKIFIASTESSKSEFSWKSVDLENGKLSSSNDSREVTHYSPTELNSYELNKACIQNMSLPQNTEKGEQFAYFCQKNDLLELTIPGQYLLDQVFQSKQTGIIEKDLILKLISTHKSSVEQVAEILNICTNLELVMRVGFVESIIVSKHYGASWLISVQCGSSSESKLPKKETEDNETSHTKMESDFSKYFPLTAKPWRSVNSDINVPLLRDLTRSIVLFIYAYPGISKELIDRRYHTYLSPMNSKELLESLLYSEVIKRCWDKPPPPGLFSSTAPQIMMKQEITLSSCFTVTADGLDNFVGFVPSAM